MPKSKSRSRKLKRHRRSRSWVPSAIRRGPKRIIVPKEYNPAFGRKLVFENVYAKTRGGLTADDLTINARGKVVSERQQKNGLNLQKQFNWRDQPSFIANIKGGTRTSRRKSKSQRLSKTSRRAATPERRVMPSRTVKKSVKYGK